MKLIFKAFVVLSLAQLSVYGAQEGSERPVMPKRHQEKSETKMHGHCGNEYLPEVRIAAFIPTDSTYQKVYSSTPLYTLEFSARVWKGLAPFASVSYLFNSGHLVGATVSKDATKLYMVPIGLGLKYFFDVGNFQPYLGAGPLISYNRVTTDYPYIPSPQDKWAVGGLFKLGALTNINSSFFLDLFLDYNFLRVTFKNTTSKFVQVNTADLSGFALGAGLGMRF